SCSQPSIESCCLSLATGSSGSPIPRGGTRNRLLAPAGAVFECIQPQQHCAERRGLQGKLGKKPLDCQGAACVGNPARTHASRSA
ncbi:hypothetical protein G0U57_018166, partial [Chelydra serpentina]